MSWTPADIVGARFALIPSHTRHMWVENSGSQGATTPVDGSAVGQIDEPCGGFLVSGGSDGVRPLLGFSGGKAFLTFGSGKSIIAQTSIGAFRNFYISRTGTILARVKFAAANAGTSNTIADTSNGTSANVGFNFQRTTSNTIQFQVFRATAGTPTVNITSTDTVNAGGDTAWHDIIIKFTTGSGNVSLQVDNGTPVTGTMLDTSIPAAGTDAYGRLTIGGRSESTNNPALCDIASFVILDQVISNEDLALWRAWNPSALTSDTLVKVSGSGSVLDPDDVNFLHTWYDFADLATMWTTSAKSTPVASNGDKIGYVANKRNWISGSNLGRDASQATDAKRPEYRTNQFGSVAAGFWDGNVDDIATNDFDNEKNLGFAIWQSGGRTVIAVYKQTNSTLGSHIFAGNSNSYYVQTSSGYLSGTRGDGVVHTVAKSLQSPVASDPEGANIMAFRQHGGDGTAYMNGSGLSTTGLTLFPMANIGRPAITDWDMAGNVGVVLVYNADLGTATVQKIVNGLAATYGVSEAIRRSAGAALMRRRR